MCKTFFWCMSAHVGNHGADVNDTINMIWQKDLEIILSLY